MKVCTRGFSTETDIEGAIVTAKVALGCIDAPVFEGGVELAVVSSPIRSAVSLPRVENF